MSSNQKKLRCLLRRARYLTRLIAQRPEQPMDFEREELAALRWAIEQLDPHMAKRLDTAP